MKGPASLVLSVTISLVVMACGQLECKKLSLCRVFGLLSPLTISCDRGKVTKVLLQRALRASHFGIYYHPYVLQYVLPRISHVPLELASLHFLF